MGPVIVRILVIGAALLVCAALLVFWIDGPPEFWVGAAVAAVCVAMTALVIQVWWDTRPD